MSKQDEALAAMGVDVNNLPDNLETTKLQAVCDALGIDTSDMTDNLKSSYYEQIANEYTGGGGGGVNVLNENGVIKREYLPAGYPYLRFDEGSFGAWHFVESDGVYVSTAEEALPTPNTGTYSVDWNGTTYNSTLVTIESMRIIGNLSVLEMGEDTGEPFVILLTGEGSTQVLSLDGYDPRTNGIEITGLFGHYETIAPEYISKEIPPCVEFKTTSHIILANGIMPIEVSQYHGLNPDEGVEGVATRLTEDKENVLFLLKENMSTGALRNVHCLRVLSVNHLNNRVVLAGEIYSESDSTGVHLHVVWDYSGVTLYTDKVEWSAFT